MKQLARSTSSVSMMNLDTPEEQVVKTNSGRYSTCYYELHLLPRHDKLSAIRSGFTSMEALLYDPESSTFPVSAGDAGE